MTFSPSSTRPQRPAGSSPVLGTKLHPPPRREHTVARDRLVERLSVRAGVKLTVLAAPAGYGKTTLLAAWREAEPPGRPVAWLTLDEGDDDPAVLWAHVLEALHKALPDLDAAAGVALPELVNELDGRGHVTLILDDFHRLSGGEARDGLLWLVEHAPPGFHVLVASRNEPAFPIAAMRAHGELAELRAAELGFTLEEAEALLNGRLDLGLAADDVRELVERTEGWPAGLYLAALSLRGCEDRAAFVRTFGGQSRHVVDFLVDEVLDACDPAVQALMLRSSIVGHLCGPLCDAILDEKGSSERLAALARTNLFLIPLDDHGEWFRFHQLFARLLRMELEHREPGLAPELHRRASRWYREQGLVDRAISHALDAGADADAAELIAGAWMEYVNASRHATVLAWLDRLPEHSLYERPELLAARAWVLSLSGRREAAAEAAAAVEQLAQADSGDRVNGADSLDGGMATLRSTIASDSRSALEHARRAAELEGPESRWRPAVCCALGLALYFDGRPGEAEAWLTEASELAALRGQWRVATAALSYRSLLAGEEGRLDQQAVLADRAALAAREHGLGEANGEVSVALGASRAAAGAVEEALPLLERGVAAMRPQGARRELWHALLRLAAASRSAGRGEAAAAAIAEVHESTGVLPLPPLVAGLLAALERPPESPRVGPRRVLSDRELTILRMLRGRLSERDIGRELYLSHNTIHSHTRSIYRKLGVSSRSEALDEARTLGLL